MKNKKPSNLRILAKSIREYKKPSLLTPVFVALEVVMEILIPFTMANLIDEMTGSTMSPIYRYGLMLLFMAALALVFGILAGRKAATASSGFAKNLRQDLYYNIQEFSFNEIDHFNSSSLVTRLTTDVTNVQNAYQMLLRIAVRTPLMMVFAFVMSLSISWELGLIFVFVIPILGAGLFMIMRKVFPIFRRIFKKYDQLNNTVQENVSGIRVVKSFVRESHEIDKFHLAADDVKNEFTKAEKLIALNNPLMMFSVNITMLLIAFFGARMIINSAGMDLTTGQLSSLITYSMQILMSVMMLSMVFVMISIAMEPLNRISEVLRTEASLDSNKEGLKTVIDGSISFNNVDFRYSKTADRCALENINLDIKSGQTVGILGMTGSGKSTLVNLIPRLYDVTGGEILVGGKNVKSYDIEALREEVAVVLQKNVLFSGTIKDNLKWGNLNASLDDMKLAAKLACADEFIDELEDGYDAHVDRGGSNFSGGQKQRLCIARALVKKPKIIIFDDSTSAVDTKTNAKINQAMNEYLPNMTKIIIAQRISSIENSDLIIVLEDGKIVSSGTHDDLMRSSESYRETYLAQNEQTGGEQ